MAYWLFQANPKRYRILDALAELDEITWQVNQHSKEIHAGDGVTIWKAGDHAGVYAVTEVIAEPAVQVSTDDNFWTDSADPGGTANLRVRLRITHRLLDKPILRTDIVDDPQLSSLSIIRFTQGTNFPVSEDEWNRLLELAGLNTATDVNQDAEHSLDVAEIHLRQAIARDLTQVAPDLAPYFDERMEEYPVPGGRIDLLCKDRVGQPVIIELKRHHWNVDKAVGQIARYMGWARQVLADGGPVRGILLILDDGTVDRRLEDAVRAVPGLEIRRYSITFRVT